MPVKTDVPNSIFHFPFYTKKQNKSGIFTTFTTFTTFTIFTTFTFSPLSHFHHFHIFTIFTIFTLHFFNSPFSLHFKKNLMIFREFHFLNSQFSKLPLAFIAIVLSFESLSAFVRKNLNVFLMNCFSLFLKSTTLETKAILKSSKVFL